MDERHAAGRELKKVVTPDAKRKAVAYLMETHLVSQRPLPGSGLLANHERGRALP